MRQDSKRSVSLEAKALQKFSADQRYLIGVSGGRDSVALLHQLAQLGYGRLIVCHLDHQLRGRSSNSDAKFVGRLAAKLDCEFELGRRDVAALARKTRQSIETAGRMARYEFFARVARRRRCRTLFLAHHADDLVETFLMNLFRGAGTTGLAGMREVASRCIAGTELTIVRPLLGVWREEIDRYVKAHRIEFRDDATNENLGPARNRFRRRIIPYIEKQLGRNVRATVWRAAMIAADEAEWLEGMVDLCESTVEQLDAGKLRAQPRALQRRVIQKWLQSRGIENLDFELIERVRALLEPETKIAKTNLPRGLHVRRRAKKIFIE
ncbi:MAG TPA: tRNA lysidine(34) synthetase TilS [Chthoniobacterales bacterium]|nr:tRNA lysidine(34) synthetase TilS [Chthoniobacterales bacterium]